jgi:hypothetical protein
VKGKILTPLAAISFLLCIGVVVMWQRSFRWCDKLVTARERGDHLICTSEFGLLVIEIEASQKGVVQRGWSRFDTQLPRRFGHRDSLLGFAAYRGWSRHYLPLPPAPLWGVSIPYWFIFIASAAIPCMWVARQRRRWRIAARLRDGLCQRCGYDLRASAKRCPECGLENHLPKNLLIE